ncbi:hypothetical protein FG111_05720 [Lactobacillus kunkeei]|uniref:hypothetical protein n=1 Tax=Apilactobacillus kunkeei TaxID=148814 RepID=UPI0013622982|nr:hypothetical protein [Apilactobacillus kunkeei]NBI01077.1 hypothetical protein [Apilactobacillus kunkeei]
MDVNANFPYPVMTPVRNDFNNMGSFHADINFDTETGFLNVNCILTNQSIKEYIDKGFMEYAVIISCSHSKYRSVLTQSNSLFQIKLDPTVLDEKVVIQTFIIVKRKIDDFNTDHLSEIYKGLQISYDAGSYVAISDNYNLKINFGNESKSFITIKSNDNVQDIEVNVDENKILVTLSPTNFKYYEAYLNDINYRDIVAYNLIISSVTSAVYQIINDMDSDPEDYDWLDAMLDKANMDFNDIKESPSEVQKLITSTFKNPVTRLFKTLDNLSDNEEYANE